METKGQPLPEVSCEQYGLSDEHESIYTSTPALVDPSSSALRFDDYIMSNRHDFPILVVLNSLLVFP